MDIDWNAKPTTAGYLLAVTGTAIGMFVGNVLGQKIRAHRRYRKMAKSLDHAIQNPTIVPNVPGSPIDLAMKKYRPES